ncbi:MAG: sulfotransferase [Pseudomonadota bacterium]
MKSGTTWLYRQLEQHPDIYFSPEKELHYLAWRAGQPGVLSRRYRLYRCINAWRRRHSTRRFQLRWYMDYVCGARTPDWYQRRFRHAPANSYPTDFSNLSALLDEADWRALAAEVNDLRVMYLLRNPLDRIWSHIRSQCRNADDEQQLQSLTQYSPLPGLSEETLLRHSRYGANLERMLRAVPDGHVHLALHDSIASNPIGVLREVEGFLGIGAHSYADAKLERRINAATPLPRPGWIREHFLPRIESDLEKLAQYGVSVPTNWYQ